MDSDSIVGNSNADTTPIGAPDICLFVSTEQWDLESAFIRWGTLCSWSHAGWYKRSTGETFSAMSDGKGLAWRPVRKGQHLLLLDAMGASESLKIAQLYTGARYDFRDIIGMILRRNWRTKGKFICDVAVFDFQQRAGYPLLNHTFIPVEHLAPDDILKSPFVKERKS